VPLSNCFITSECMEKTTDWEPTDDAPTIPELTVTILDRIRADLTEAINAINQRASLLVKSHVSSAQGTVTVNITKLGCALGATSAGRDCCQIKDLAVDVEIFRSALIDALFNGAQAGDLLQARAVGSIVSGLPHTRPDHTRPPSYSPYPYAKSSYANHVPHRPYDFVSTGTG
jgi:hypothetical protein